MYVAAGERVEEQVPALAGLHHLGQQRGFGGQRRPVHLYTEQGLDQTHLVAFETATRGGTELFHHRIGQFAR